jgi:isoquinoline 1-oxidoreductase beta subunit
VTISRRDFVRMGGSAVALGLAFRLPSVADIEVAPSEFSPNAYLSIGADDRVTLWVPRLEMGQGVRTLLPLMLAEELDVAWERVQVEQAEPWGRFRHIQLHTSGSDSSRESYPVLRAAGATAREMLVAAAAEQWGVEPAACTTAQSIVTHAATGRTASYGSLVAAAARQPIPAHPTLKNPAAFRLLGKPHKRIDGPAIVTGRVRYGADVRVPGMLYASIERAPTLGGTVVRVDDSATLRVPGVRRVARVTAGVHQGVAVLADDTWSAMRGREALRVEWAPGPAASFDSERFLAGLPGQLEHATYPVRHEGDADAAIRAASRVIEATYVWPFQAHATMEPMNCTAAFTRDALEIWVPTQTDIRTLEQASRVSGLPAEQITVHPALVGGGFGRRLFADFVAETVELSQQVGKPVQLLWTRQDDMRYGYYNPATAERFTAALDAAGNVIAIRHRTSSSDLTIYDIHHGRDIWREPATPKAADRYAGDNGPWGSYDFPYVVPSLRVDCADVTSPLPTGPWRAVEYPSTVFGRESFIDEIAHAAGRDPIAWRLAALTGAARMGPFGVDRARLARVLEAVRDRAGWATPLAERPNRMRGRGVAANPYDAGSYIAMVAEVSVAGDLSDLRVERIVTVVDCGIALNPLGVDGQTESGITWGLSAALHGRLVVRDGGVTQSSYADYPVVRIGEMPRLETILLDSGGAPSGFGEHAVPPVAPAVANAVFAATGRRVRELPISAQALQRA